ncbi:threonine ammonia-lyase [Microbacterium halotolerans]|uniref:threonine ammonia-lyase n=1 Tax=Microbacterium halotolerans TaxID=246613 RepID=UPI001F09D25A|nr:threonine/serine dehydratase [Microbacterium halotolerans]
MTELRTVPTGSAAVTGEDIVAARTRIGDAVVRTPLLSAPWATGDLWLKAESLQTIGAFKIRGAVNAIRRLVPEQRARGVITHSSGNHGQAVSWAARAAGIPAVIVMPENAAEVKIVATRALGAEVVFAPGDGREAVAGAIQRERGLVMIPPYDAPDVISGQGTLALEVLEDLESVDSVLAPVGGGGLISGVGVAVRHLSPATRVVGVESELAADARDSLAAGRRVTWDPRDVARTIADGTRAPVLGRLTFPLIQSTVSEIVTVSETEILAAMSLLARRSRLVVEPSGALAVAAFLRDPNRFGRTVAILSGGNVEPDILADALTSLPGRTFS